MRILVTGGSGLMGHALREMGLSEYVFVDRTDADLRHPEATVRLFQRIAPTHVIHLAAVVGGLGGNMAHSGRFFRDNALINLNVLEAARLTGVKRLVSFLSTCVFPDSANYPLTPDQLHDGEPHPSNFGYAYAKRMLEVQSRAYRSQWGVDFVVGIPTNVYGPHDNWSLSQGHVVPSLIHKAYLAKLSMTPLVVWGSGEPLREFIFAGDVARLADWMVRNYSGLPPLLLTSGTETSVRDLAYMVMKAIDYDGDVIFDLSKPEGQFRKPSDASPLQSLLPTFEFTPLEDGLRKTASWFVESFPNVRH